MSYYHRKHRSRRVRAGRRNPESSKVSGLLRERKALYAEVERIRLKIKANLKQLNRAGHELYDDWANYGG